jgi:hypothetical protein
MMLLLALALVKRSDATALVICRLCAMSFSCSTTANIGMV